MPRKMHLISLNDEERQSFETFTRKGKAKSTPRQKARQFKWAIILLKTDEGLSDLEIMAALNVSRP